MPIIFDDTERSKKRKREDKVSKGHRTKKRTREDSDEEIDSQAEIVLLESQILESRKYYNNISELLDYMQDPDFHDQKDVLAADALCRVYSSFMSAGNLIKNKDTSGNQVTIVQWLKEKYQEYKNTLLKILVQGEPTRQISALTLLMHLIKREKNYLTASNDAAWRTGTFARLMQSLTSRTVSEGVKEEFVGEYVEKYDDVRYYTLECLADIASSNPSESVTRHVLAVLTAIETIPEQQEELNAFFADRPEKPKHDLNSLVAHKKQAQKAWMAVLRGSLSKAQRKHILDVMSYRIAPWFSKAELLMDFLTDSFNVGGSTSLMALSGLFYLIQHKNLDYPQFYPKLYSLLDSTLLHSKYRSRFFRLLDTFFASTHLPAALVASFIKRLSRLSLHAPPSSIVVVVPWIYNLLKNHPTCTFMIHRNADIEQDEDGWGDPFRMDESDPLNTDALESSLWEIQTLQSHYHPNVATIAKIISEQFTKQSYNLEDFLDHSYGTMLDAELSKDLKKPPEIEYRIPKRVFLKNDPAHTAEDSLLTKLWDFS